MVENGTIPGFAWDSASNAVSPFDFSIIDGGTVVRKIEAKSTAGDFKNPIHVSLAELQEMAEGGAPYDICRIYSVKQNSARMRIAMDVGGFAKTVLDYFAGLPEGVRVDGVSIDPEELDFGKEVILDFSEPPEGEAQVGLSDE